LRGGLSRRAAITSGVGIEIFELVPCDFFPPDKLSFRDFGAILVADHEATQVDVPPSRLRTYWVSGFSGVGHPGGNSDVGIRFPQLQH